MRRSVGFAVLALLLTVDTAAAQNSFYFWGVENEYISAGTEHAGTDAHGVFEGGGSAELGSAEVHFDSTVDAAWWDFRFQSSDREPLVPGSYLNAVRYPFNEIGQHGLSISGSGRGCNRLFGHFTILRISYQPDGSLQSLAAEFEQDCEENGLWLHGWVRFNSNLAPDYDNIVENGGFEEGVITKSWSSDTWTIWDGDSHFGMKSAVTKTGGALTVEIDAVPVEFVQRVSFWLKQVPEVLIAVDLMYDDGTYDQIPVFETYIRWTFYDLVEHVRPKGALVGLRFIGATSSSDQVTTMLDDVYVKTPYVLGDDFESGDLTSWSVTVGVP
ncbi:MAG: hypothetical protein MPN21_18515 [Thermoanaerobaculia bacterium]|nr:hypothetical protein [Thermoanaerobaculia bacterium]